MDWSIDYWEKDQIVSATTSGVMDWESHKKFCNEVFSFARQRGSHKVFIDFREMVPDFNILQIDDLPKFMREKCGVGPEFRIAALFDESSPHSSEFAFFKNTAFLASITVKYFPEKEDAIAWLKLQN